MSEWDYRTVVEEYQGKLRKGSGKKRDCPRDFTRREIWRWCRLLFCAVFFFSLVVAKVSLPEQFGEFSQTMERHISQRVDYRAVFGAVGKAVSGENSVGKALGDVYAEVFHPDPISLEAVETAAQVSVPEKNDPAEESCLKDGEGGAPEEEKTPPPQPSHPKEPPPAGESKTSEEKLPKGVSMEQRPLGIPCAAPVSGVISSPFGYREHPVSGERKFHRGLDIAAPEGSTIVAFADGRVKAVGESSSLGRYLMLSHDGAITTLYAHCSEITVSDGAAVQKGDSIAKVGHTGMATGPHLHFAVQQNGVYLDPEQYIALEKPS